MKLKLSHPIPALLAIATLLLCSIIIPDTPKTEVMPAEVESLPMADRPITMLPLEGEELQNPIGGNNSDDVSFESTKSGGVGDVYFGPPTREPQR